MSALGRSRCPHAAAALAAGLLCVPGMAAFGQTVSEVHASLRGFADSDAAESGEAVEELYLGLHRQADSSGVEIVRDVRYGVFPRQVLDLHLPAGRGGVLLPIVVFVHGGNLDDGDKAAAGAEEYLYGNVATFFARHGFIGVNANYRLVPDIVWPQGAEDMREILGWLRTENAESYGGDPNSMFMVAVSGSARHLASYLFYRLSQMISSRTNLLGAVLISPWLGAGDQEALGRYYGDGQERFSPLALVATFDPDEPRVPVLLLSGEFDPANVRDSADGMYAGLCEKYGTCPEFRQLRSHNGFSAIASFNTADETVSGEVLEFVQGIYRTRGGAE